MSTSTDATQMFPRRIVVASVVCVAYALVLLNLLPALALDVEALIINRFPDHLQRDAAVFWCRLALRVGSIPLAVPVLLRLVLWAVPRAGSWERLLGRVPLALKLLWGVLLLAIHAAFCVPLAVALSVWLSVEAAWWIQWYQNIPPMMGQIFDYSVFVALPGMWALAPLVLLFQLSRPPTGKAGVARWALRGLAALWLLVALAALGPCLLGGGAHALQVVTAPGRSILESTCDGCHARTRPLYFIKTPAEWRRTVTRMKEFEKAPLSSDDKEDVLAYLGGMRSFSDAWTFRTRCQRCHVTSYLGWDDRDPKDWAAIVDRVARWSPYYYKQDVRDQIKAHLAATRAEQGSTLGLDRATYQRSWKVGKICSSCHSISRSSKRYRGKDLETIRRLVSDMRHKMVTRFDRGQIKSVAAAYKALLDDPELLSRLFPHDQLIKEGGPSW